jgi:organic hydroperoxide reductase OsmC/OhrA
METIEQPKVRHKTFVYKTNLNWIDGKSGTLSSNGKPSIRVASPPEFKGETGVWTPEDLFTASIEICLMSTFLSFAQRHGLSLISYQSAATGTLAFIDGNYRFTHVVLSPHIVVAAPTTESDVRSIVHDSHRHCLIANSINTIVEVNPKITVQ